MKKLIAVLLAVMLLPAAALADAASYQLQISLDETQYRQELEAALASDAASMLGVDGDMLDAVTGIICTVLDASAFSCTVQDDGLRVSWQMQQNEIVHALLTWTDEELALSTSLLPETLLTYHYADALSLLGGVDWNEVAAALEAACMEWYLTRDVTFDVTGSFAGAAYEGGNERILVRVDDMELALLLDGLLLEIEKNDALMNLLSGFGSAEGLADSLRSFRSFNHQAAIDNQYEYELSVVYHTEGLYSEAVGISVNVWDQGEAAWSVSIGWEEENARVIAAFHVDGMTNYFAFTEETVANGSADSEKTSVFAVYQAAHGESYDAISADPANALAYYESVAASTRTGVNAHYRMETETTTRMLESGMLTSETRDVTVEEYSEKPYYLSVESRSFIGSSDEPAVTIRLSGSEASPWAQPGADVRVYDIAQLLLNEDQQEAVALALEDGLAQTTTLLFKSVPAELLLDILLLTQ